MYVYRDIETVGMKMSFIKTIVGVGTSLEYKVEIRGTNSHVYKLQFFFHKGSIVVTDENRRQ